MYLGVPRYRPTMAEEQNENRASRRGWPWTEAGGELLLTESTLMPGKGRLTLTGKLGDVMQGVGAGRDELRAVEGRGVRHPEGLSPAHGRPRPRPRGVDFPKDGPSAGHHPGETALVSNLASVPTRRDVAMTGEITLRGKVLPIGGVKEKVLAAHRAGVKTIILPKDNEKDLADIPKTVLDVLEMHLVESMDEVLKIALAEPLVSAALGR